MRPYTLSKKLLANLVYVVILFNLQLPVFKDRVRTPSGANEGIVYHFRTPPRKGGFAFIPNFRSYWRKSANTALYYRIYSGRKLPQIGIATSGIVVESCGSRIHDEEFCPVLEGETGQSCGRIDGERCAED